MLISRKQKTELQCRQIEGDRREAEGLDISDKSPEYGSSIRICYNGKIKSLVYMVSDEQPIKRIIISHGNEQLYRIALKSYICQLVQKRGLNPLDSLLQAAVPFVVANHDGKLVRTELTIMRDVSLDQWAQIIKKKALVFNLKSARFSYEPGFLNESVVLLENVFPLEHFKLDILEGHHDVC